MAELRPLQQAALEKLRETLLTGSKRPVIQAPCGFGKTVLAAAIVQGALAKNRRVTFCVPLISLIDQSFERFVENGIDPGDIGVIQADHEWRRPQAPVQIASIQTIGRRGFPLTDFVIVDECHIQFGALARWMGDDEKRIFIGLSATPWARGMGKLWDFLLVAAIARELIETGLLSPFRIFAPSHPDLSGIKTVAGDYHEGQLAERMSQPTLIADVVATWLDKAEGRPTLVFAVNRAHAALIHEQFSQAGITSAYVDAFTPREERVALGKSFDRGELKVICSVGTMGTGVDLDVRCIVNARPTKSEIRWVQDIGRGLRTAAGKDMALILDHSDTALRLGLPTDIHHSALDDGERQNTDRERSEKSVPMPKECPACTCLVPPGQRECPHCGLATKRASNVITVDGELTEIGGKSRTKNEPVKARLVKMGRAEIFGQIKAVGRERKWSAGRQAHCYRDIFDCWPNGQKDAPEKPPSFELLSWIRASNIAFAKSRKRKDSHAA